MIIKILNIVNKFILFYITTSSQKLYNILFTVVLLSNFNIIKF